MEAFTAIDEVVRGGQVVMAADDGSVLATVREAIKSGRSATFYLPRTQADAIKAWYWSPGRIKEAGMEPVSPEEKARIESELGVKCTGSAYSNKLSCECGGVYGAFEFLQQGIREHGKEMVEAIFALENASVIRVNPNNSAICAKCNVRMLAGHEYDYRNYGCCCEVLAS
ncbi:hypothetical protein [Streptomyces sp. Caat 7-52]|uniref:hypothetical protein n=1 Tax=Streptomyces sp. Caat 7-52 TaxID=2949637 RepID=UPI002035D1A6|nr:hypothetical protein [Streptomyces sp. Caat 7-52]